MGEKGDITANRHLYEEGFQTMTGRKGGHRGEKGDIAKIDICTRRVFRL